MILRGPLDGGLCRLLRTRRREQFRMPRCLLVRALVRELLRGQPRKRLRRRVRELLR